MVQIEVVEAQQRLPELLNAVEAGEEVEIRAQNGRTYRLAPSRPRPPVTGVPKAGRLKGHTHRARRFQGAARRTARVHGMRLLLDAHALLWFLADDPKLSASAKAAIEDPANERWLSPISLLEIALKNRRGKLPLPAPFGTLFPSGADGGTILHCYRSKPGILSLSQRCRFTTTIHSTGSSRQHRWSTS